MPIPLTINQLPDSDRPDAERIIVRSRVLFQDVSLRVLATAYPPGARYAPHRDALSRITLSLQGQVAEDTRQGADVLQPGDVLLKSRTELHENRFGPAGARLVSLLFLTESEENSLPDKLDAAWKLSRDAGSLRASAAALEAAIAGDGSTLRAATADLASTADPLPGRCTGGPPAWLDRMRADVEQAGLGAIDATARARDAGVHPVHASRLFRRYFGASLTDHAQYHAVRRAISDLGAGETLGETAVASGFYDQSHMSRVFRRITGRTPGAWRRLADLAAC